MWATIAEKRVSAVVINTMSCFGTSNNHHYCLTKRLTKRCIADATSGFPHTHDVNRKILLQVDRIAYPRWQAR